MGRIAGKCVTDFALENPIEDANRGPQAVVGFFKAQRSVPPLNHQTAIADIESEEGIADPGPSILTLDGDFLKVAEAGSAVIVKNVGALGVAVGDYRFVAFKTDNQIAGNAVEISFIDAFELFGLGKVFARDTTVFDFNCFAGWQGQK